MFFEDPTATTKLSTLSKAENSPKDKKKLKEDPSDFFFGKHANDMVTSATSYKATTVTDKYNNPSFRQKYR